MEEHLHRKWLLATPRQNSLPVGIGDQRQASVVPRHLPQDGEDEEQHLAEGDGGGLPVSIGMGKAYMRPIKLFNLVCQT